MDVAEGAAAHVPSQFKAPLVRQVADAAAGDFGRLAAALVLAAVSATVEDSAAVLLVAQSHAPVLVRQSVEELRDRLVIFHVWWQLALNEKVLQLLLLLPLNSQSKSQISSTAHLLILKSSVQSYSISSLTSRL